MPNRSVVAAQQQLRQQLRQRRIAHMIGTENSRRREDETDPGHTLEDIPGTAANFRKFVRSKER